MFKLFSIICAVLCATLITVETVYSQDNVNVTVVDWSPNGTQIATGNTLGDVEIWNVDAGALVNTLHGHTQEIMVLQWSPNGSLLASGSPDGTIRIWDVVSGQATQVMIFTPPDSLFRAILDIDWSPDSTFVVGARETGSIVIWDIRTGESQTLFSHDDMALTVAWSPSGNLIASGGADDKLFLWDTINQSLSEFAPISSEDLGSVDSIDWSADGNRIAVATRRGGIRIFDLSTDSLVFHLPQPPRTIASLNWSPDNTELAIRNRETVTVVNTITGNVVGSIVGNTVSKDVVWSPYGGQVAVRNGEYRSDTQLGNAVQIFVPAPSLERLQAIGRRCNTPANVMRTLNTPERVPAFVTQIRALTAAQIPPGCAADLIAVAEALQNP